MKTEEEMEKRLSEINSDSRLRGKPATIQINAPLALIQLALETERDTLKWVLDKEI